MAMGPKDLPNALAKAQEIESNQIRLQFSSEISQTRNQVSRYINAYNDIRNISKQNNYNQHSNRLRFDHRSSKRTAVIETLDGKPNLNQNQCR